LTRPRKLGHFSIALDQWIFSTLQPGFHLAFVKLRPSRTALPRRGRGAGARGGGARRPRRPRGRRLRPSAARARRARGRMRRPRARRGECAPARTTLCARWGGGGGRRRPLRRDGGGGRRGGGGCGGGDGTAAAHGGAVSVGGHRGGRRGVKACTSVRLRDWLWPRHAHHYISPQTTQRTDWESHVTNCGPSLTLGTTPAQSVVPIRPHNPSTTNLPVDPPAAGGTCRRLAQLSGGAQHSPTAVAISAGRVSAAMPSG